MLANELMSLVTVLALALYAFMGFRVGEARVKFNVAAPATTGHPEFERTFRVQQNTLEGLALFLPSMWLFASFVNAWAAALLGAVWIVGRFMYMQGYVRAANERSTGFTIQAIAVVVLLAGSLLGILWSIIT